jgi:hypothetical protein
MNQKWVKQHEKKLRRAQRAAQKWLQTKTEEPWKEWVERNYPGISRKFLTRAVNNGELSEPSFKKKG